MMKLISSLTSLGGVAIVVAGIQNGSVTNINNHTKILQHQVSLVHRQEFYNTQVNVCKRQRITGYIKEYPIMVQNCVAGLRTMLTFSNASRRYFKHRKLEIKMNETDDI